jgi:hypothetical protein
MQRPAMRLTVGPHPPAVYWRRRALVAAGVAVLVLLGWYALNGSGGSKPAAVGSAPAATGGPPTGVASGAASGPGDLASPSFVPAPPDTTTSPSAARSAPPPSVAPCTDEQIAVTVAASPSPGVVGGTFTFTIAIASRTEGWCARDLGPGAQEIRILRDGALLFSSDSCNSDRRSDVRAFAAGDAVRYRYSWSSYRTTPHDCTQATTPAPAGTYQVVARIGTKVSAPAAFTINR